MNLNTGVCTWDSVIPGTTINWERSDWRTALQMGSGGAGQQQTLWEPAACPGSLEGRQHPGMHQRQCNQPVKRGDCPTVLSIGAASGILCYISSSVPHNLRSMWMSLNVSREGQQRWWKGQKVCPVRRNSGPWVCLVCRKEVEQVRLTLQTACPLYSCKGGSKSIRWKTLNCSFQ